MPLLPLMGWVSSQVRANWSARPPAAPAAG